MNRRRILSLILSVALLVSTLAIINVAGDALSTGTIFMMGGAVEDNNAELYNALYEQAGGVGSPKIVVFCTAAADLVWAQDAFYNDYIDSSGKLHLSYQNLFESYGFNPVFVPIALDNYSSEAYNQSNINLINDADIVFFNGGDQSRHARCLLDDNGNDTPLMTAVRQIYNNGGIIAGTSAGTAVQGNPMYGEGTSIGYLYHNDMAEKNISDVSLEDPYDSHNHNGGYTTGFSFADSSVGAIVDTHFDARGRLGRMIVAMRELNKNIGIGVDENTALCISNGVGTVYGENGVFITDSTNATFYSSSYFEADNVVIDYLTSGDSYDFSTKGVASSKSLIQNPYYNTGYDSRDIFDEYETTKVITKLIDSEWSYAYGDTYDSYKDIRTEFTLKFQKAPATKGYYSSGKYTISKLKVDIYY